jgi:hypothetical protein
MLENKYYPKEVGYKLLSEQVLEAVKWHTSHCLDSMECVHHVGLHMRVLSGPTQAIRKKSPIIHN